MTIEKLPPDWVIEIHNTRPVRVKVRGAVNLVWGIPHDCTSEATGKTWQEAYKRALTLALVEARVASP